MRCRFVPPYLLRALATAEAVGVRADVAQACLDSLAMDEAFREARRERAAGVRPRRPRAAEAEPAWTVHSAGNLTTLPGHPVRRAGDPASGDLAVDEAADGIAATLALFEETYGRTSYDGAGAPVSLTVHFGRDYVNAFWDGEQLVFGDGDGQIFERFTKPVDVLGHEFAHAVTEHTAALVYEGQPGALNESVSDVFGACLKQRLLGQRPAEADWLVGEGLFRPGVDARGLRDMRNPGTAYDDPRLGRDPQSAHMDDYIETDEDNGGVHLNSGIANRAFVLAADAVGGTTWEGAGRIWYAALTGGGVGPDSDFAGFAAATVAAAGEHADVVRRAWQEVGVAATDARDVGEPASAEPAAGRGEATVTVRRSGGFIGRTVTGTVDLSLGDDRAAEVARLLARVDVRRVRGGRPHPDMYTYAFELPGGEQVTVPEHHLTAELRRLAELALGEGG